MSVINDKLCFPNCCEKIYTLNPDGSIVFTKTFLPLWTAFEPREPLTVNPPPFKSKYFLPQTRVVNFSGVRDPLTGFTVFKRTDGVPNINSAIMNEGLALNQYVKGVEKLDFLLEWQGSKEI